MTPLLRIRVALMLTTYPVDPDLPRSAEVGPRAGDEATDQGIGLARRGGAGSSGRLMDQSVISPGRDLREGR